MDERLDYIFILFRTPRLPLGSSRNADKWPSRPQIIQTRDDDSSNEVIELTDSSVELTPLKIKIFNSERELGQRDSSTRRAPVRLGGDESIMVL